MRIFFNRQHRILQVFPELVNVNEFVSLEIYSGQLNPLVAPDEAVLIQSVLPASVLLIPFTYDYQQVGNIFLIGVLADGNKRLVAENPIVSGDHFNAMYLNALRGLKTRKRWFKGLRSERVKIFFKSIAGQCTCRDEEFQVSDSNCTICGGSGQLAGYVGSYFDAVIDNDYKKVKLKTADGRTVTVDAFTGCVFEFPFLNDECILERATGDRYTINSVSYNHFGGQLIDMTFNMILLPDYFNFKYTLIGDSDGN